MRTRKAALTLCAVAVSASVALSGCSTSPTAPGDDADADATEDVTQDQIDEALATPTTLTYWTWVNGIQDSVDLFEAEYPEIDVEVVNLGSSTEQYPKVRAALQSGKGFPDVFQVGYDYLGSFLQTGSVLDLTPYGAAELEDSFTPAAWNQVANDQGVWAIPQDSGPLGNLYRQDIYEAAGVTEPPATWDQFAADAEKIKASTGSYITNMPGNDMPQWLGLLWQAGAKPFEYSGGTDVGIALNSPESQEVTAYWQDLIEKDLVSTDADFTDEFYQGLSRGKYASWVVAAWGPLFLQGTVAETAGLWRAAELPQWSAGDSVSGNWGGSTNAVTAQTENPIAAYELAKFVNSDFESTIHMANELSLFPTAVETLSSPDFVDSESEFFGGQSVNGLFSEIAGTVDPEFDFLPFMDYVNTAYNETLGKAIAEQGDMLAGLDAWQDKVVTYAEQQGFTVQ